MLSLRVSEKGRKARNEHVKVTDSELYEIGLKVLFQQGV